MTITNRVSLKSVMAGNTPVPDVVDAPTIGTATAGVESATVTFTAAATGGEATSFGAISTPGSITGTSATSPITVSGLTGGTAYTFKIYGINSSGTWSNVLSAASNSVTPTSTSFESIETVTVGSGGTSSISFTSIPQTYTHLQIRGIAHTPDSSQVFMRFNGDSGTNYSYHPFTGNGSVTESYGYSGQNNIQLARSNYSGANSSMVAPTVCDILDYKNTNKFKTTRSLTGNDTNGTAGQGVGIISGNWRNTNAITSITLTPSSGLITQHSQFALYGIKVS